MNSNNLIITLFILTFTVGCGGFQTSSYFLSDGIYNDSSISIEKNNSKNQINKSKYYSNYFQNISDNYSSLDYENEKYFVDSENYFSPNSYDQLPWGENISETEVYFTNYRYPGYWRGYNQYYYNPFYFNQFRYFNRYNGLAFGWGFYNPYYSPFYNSYYSPFHDYYYPFYNRRPYYGGGNYYADKGFKNQRDKSFSKSNSRRGEKNYPDSKTNNNEVSSNTKNESNSELDIKTALNRLNVGRGRYRDSRISSNYFNINDNISESKSITSLTKRPQISGRYYSSSKGSKINDKNGRRFSSSSIRNFSREVNVDRKSNQQYYRKNDFQRNNSYNNSYNQGNYSSGRSYSPSRSSSSGRSYQGSSSNNSSSSRSSSGRSSRENRPH